MPTSPRRPTVMLLLPFVGGGVPDAPPFGANVPTFCKVSGSGAGAKTILNLGHVLPKISRYNREGSPETIGFWRAFGYFSRAGKVTRRRQDTPIPPPFPRQNSKF